MKGSVTLLVGPSHATNTDQDKKLHPEIERDVYSAHGFGIFAMASDLRLRRGEPTDSLWRDFLSNECYRSDIVLCFFARVGFPSYVLVQIEG